MHCFGRDRGSRAGSSADGSHAGDDRRGSAPYATRVATLRTLIDRHLPAMWMLVLLTMAMKLVVPVGFMPDLSAGNVRLIVCTGMDSPAPMAAMRGMPGHHHDHGGPQKPDAPCPFAGLAAPALGGADPVQLAGAIAAILLAGVAAATPLRVRALAYLRPPLRGPPIRA